MRRNATTAAGDAAAERVLGLFRDRRDAEFALSVFDGGAVLLEIADNADELDEEIRRGAGTLLLTADALTRGEWEHLAETLREQPEWSALPVIIVLTSGGDAVAGLPALLHPGEVIFVDQPVRVRPLLAVVEAALKNRRRQYLLRDRMADLSREIEHRARTEQALRESEERFRLALQASTDVVWDWDLEKDVIIWNDAVGTSFGYPDATAGTDVGWWRERLHPEDREEIMSGIEAAIAGTAEDWQAEYRFLRGDGSWAYISDRGALLRRPDGRAYRMVGAMADLTPRRNMEESLQTRNRRLQLLAGLAENLLGAEAPVDAARAAFAAISGELDLHAYFNFLVEPDGSLRLDSYTGVPGHVAHLIQRLQPGEAVCGWVASRGEAWHVAAIQSSCLDRVELLRRNGLRAYYCTPLLSGSDVIGTLSFGTRSRDAFTEEELELLGTVVRHVALADQRLRAERRLRASEEQFRQLADTLPQFVWISDADGRDEYLNPRWYEFTGLDVEEVNAGELHRVVHPDDYDGAEAAWRESLATGKPFESEYRLRRAADGGYHWFLARAIPIRGGDGRIVRWFGTCTDIEAQKQAREAAEATARAKSTFMANMSHEIRTPMNGILGVTELLLETELSVQQHQYMEMVKASAEALLAIVNDILDFSKMEAGAAVLEYIDVDLRKTVEQAAETLAIRAFQKGLELTVAVDSGLPGTFRCDPAKLRQVLVNLIGNAVKFTEKGEVTVRVTGRPAKGESWLLTFAVSDTGIGIAPENQGLLFNSFTQITPATGRLYGGTGLGLAISRRLVELMGGRIWVESAEGRGSTFFFQVEFAATAGLRKEAAREPASAAPATTAAEIPLCTHVLVADDNPVNLTVTEAILRRAGIRVTAVTNGAEAVDACGRGGFNLVLMDVQMPQMDGLEATRILRARGADLPIIGLTAHALEGDRERCLAAGMDDYVSKPVTAQALKEKVAQWLRQRPAPAADMEFLLEQFGGDGESADLVVATFLDSVPAQMEAVREAVQRGDAAQLRKAAHKLKGGLMVVAAKTAWCLAEELEKGAEAEDLSRAPEYLAELEAEIARVRAKLEGRR